MNLELKDYLAGAALILSIINFIEGFRAKGRTLRQSFEQRRQEVLLVRTQTHFLNAQVRQKLEILKHDCEMQLPLDEKGRPHWINSTVALEISRYTDHFQQALTHLLDAIPNERISQKHLLDFEVKLGEAKRELEAAKTAAEEAKKFDEDKRKLMEKIKKGEA